MTWRRVPGGAAPARRLLSARPGAHASLRCGLSATHSLESLSRLNLSLKLCLSGSTLRRSTLNGLDYLIVPVVAMRGDNVVWPVNAPFPEFIPADVITANASQWDNRPIVLNHPREGNNYVPVSSNAEAILNAYCFGFTSNARASADGKDLLMDAWISQAQASQVGADAEDVCRRLENGERVEVSIGAFVGTVESYGSHNGISFKAEWIEIEADHLAVLPAGIEGACSVAAGCGAGVELATLAGNENQNHLTVNALSHNRNGVHTMAVKNQSHSHPQRLVTLAQGSTKAAFLATYRGMLTNAGVLTLAAAAAIPDNDLIDCAVAELDEAFYVPEDAYGFSASGEGYDSVLPLTVEEIAANRAQNRALESVQQKLDNWRSKWDGVPVPSHEDEQSNVAAYVPPDAYGFKYDANGDLVFDNNVAIVIPD